MSEFERIYQEAKRKQAEGKSHENNGDGRPAEPVVVTMASVEGRDVSWLWPLAIPRGAVTLLDGDPGLGKSTITTDLAARVSRGWEMPPASGPCEGAEPEGVLLLNAEDDEERTIKPRLVVAGADVAKVHLLKAVLVAGQERPPVLPCDLDLIGELIASHGVGLVVVDPFMAFLDGGIDAHKDQDVRHCLHLLKELGQRTRAAILIIRHLNKLNAGPAIYRGGGSIGITGAARSTLVVGRDPEHRGTLVLASAKSNLGPPPPSLTYSIETVEGVASIAWGKEVDLSADEILAHPAPRPRQSVGGQCADAIRAILAGGVVKESGELDAQLREMGYGKHAIEAGRRLAGVKASRVSFGGKYLVSLADGALAPHHAPPCSPHTNKTGEHG
jgi:hypothetical protein